MFHEFIRDQLPKDQIDFINPNCVSSLVWYNNILNLVFHLPVSQQKELAEKYVSDYAQSSPPEDNQSVHFVFDQDEDFPCLDSIPPISIPVALSDAHCHLNMINNRTLSPLSLTVNHSIMYSRAIVFLPLLVNFLSVQKDRFMVKYIYV